MSTVPRVGGDVDAFCTRCKLKLGHTILAMVGTRIARVRCNTCQGEHAYRASAPGASRRRDTAPRTAKPEARELDLDELLRGKDLTRAHRYSTSEIFFKGEVVEHVTFGTGVVIEVRGDRFDTLFRGGIKTLAQRKAHAALTEHHERAEAPADAQDLSEADGSAEESQPI